MNGDAGQGRGGTARAWGAVLRAPLLIAAAGLAALAEWHKVHGEWVRLSFWVNLAAVVALAAAAPRGPDSSPVEPSPRSPSPRTRKVGIALAVLGFAGALACSVAVVVRWDRYLITVIALGPVALAALALGLDLMAGYGERWVPSGSRLRTSLQQREIQVLLLIFAIGVLYRFGSIGHFPPPNGFSSIEETQRATTATFVLKGSRPWEWPIAIYLNAATFALFGSSIWAVRVPTMILGCLTLFPFYGLARRMVSGPAALFATALLAVSRWHVQVSWYNEDVYTPLFPFVVILYLMVRTRTDPRPSYYVLLGALCGYTLYDYAGFRGSVGVVGVFLFVDAIWQRSWPADWKRIGLAFAIAAMVGAPLPRILPNVGNTTYLEAFQRSFANEGYYTSDVNSFVEQRLRRLGRTVDTFTYSDHAEFFPSLNTDDAPLLDPITSVCFVLGFGSTLLLVRRRHHFYFVSMFVFLTFVATIVVQNLDFRRLAALIPFAFLLVAFAAQRLQECFESWNLPRLGSAILLVLAVGAGGANAHFLFQRLARSPTTRGWHRDEYTTAAFYLREHLRGEYVIFATPILENFFMPNDYDWIKPEGLEGHPVKKAEQIMPFDPNPPRGRDVLLIAERPFAQPGFLERVESFYPGSRCEFLPDPDDPRWDFGACQIPAAAIEAGYRKAPAASPAVEPQPRPYRDRYGRLVN